MFAVPGFRPRIYGDWYSELPKLARSRHTQQYHLERCWEVLEYARGAFDWSGVERIAYCDRRYRTDRDDLDDNCRKICTLSENEYARWRECIEREIRRFTNECRVIESSQLAAAAAKAAAAAAAAAGAAAGGGPGGSGGGPRRKTKAEWQEETKKREELARQQSEQDEIRYQQSVIKAEKVQKAAKLVEDAAIKTGDALRGMEEIIRAASAGVDSPVPVPAPILPAFGVATTAPGLGSAAVPVPRERGRSRSPVR